MSQRAARGLPAILLCILIAGASGPAFAQHRAQLVKLPLDGSIAGLEKSAAVRPDPRRELDPAQLIRSDAGFESYSSALEERAPPLWLKLRLAAPRGSDGQYVLRISRRFFQDLDVYVPGRGGRLQHYGAAFDEAVTARTVGREYVVAFRVPPGQTQTLLIYASIVQGSLQPLEIRAQDRDSFADSQSVGFLAFGLMFGVLVALIFHNLVLYLNLRQRGHLFYVLAMASLLVLLGVDSGLLQTYFLPEALLPQVSRLYLLVHLATLLSMGLFFLAFVNPRRLLPRWTRAIEISLWVIGGLLLAALVVPMRQLLALGMLMLPVQLVAQFMLLAGAFMAGRRGSTEGYIFLAAWLVVIVSGFSRVFMSLDWVPRTNGLEYLMYVGAVIEASILALGLTWRVRQLHDRHARALEEQHKAARLANLDPLTEAYNRRFLQTYLEGVEPDAPRDAFDRAVLILDLDDFKATNDRYGHAAGDQVLRDLVRRCRRVLRDSDVLCRLGGDEFVIVLSDQNDRSALEIARRIIDEVAARPFLFEGTAIPVTTSIGVVSTVSPRCAVSDILRMADQALYQAKQAGRNRAVLFDPDRATPFRQGPSRAHLREEG